MQNSFWFLEAEGRFQEAIQTKVWKLPNEWGFLTPVASGQHPHQRRRAIPKGGWGGGRYGGEG